MNVNVIFGMYFLDCAAGIVSQDNPLIGHTIIFGLIQDAGTSQRLEVNLFALFHYLWHAWIHLKVKENIYKDWYPWNSTEKQTKDSCKMRLKISVHVLAKEIKLFKNNHQLREMFLTRQTAKQSNFCCNSCPHSGCFISCLAWLCFHSTWPQCLSGTIKSCISTQWQISKSMQQNQTWLKYISCTWMLEDNQQLVQD